MSAITTHVLDTSLGCPARGMEVVLDRRNPDESWTEVGRGHTSADGRLTSLMSDQGLLAAGIYRLKFLTGAYFASQGVSGFYPAVEVQFLVDKPAGHYHVPLLLSPFGYSTYRGS